MEAVAEATIITPDSLTHNVVQGVEERINAFVNKVNQLSGSIVNEIDSLSLIELQRDMDEFMHAVQLAAKISGEAVKSINSLANMQ